MVTPDQIQRMFPNAEPSWLAAMQALAPELCVHYAFEAADWRHFCGQIWAETNGLSLGAMRENMRFTTAARIKQVYSYRLRLALERDPALRREHGTVDGLARACVGRPELLADIAYGGREGTPHGQGHRFIGRGPTQITHLNNYRAIGQEIKRQPGGSSCPDLIQHPEALESPEWGIRSAFADWKLKGLSRFARADDLENVSSALNAGSPGKWSIVNGKEERRRGYARALGVWPPGSEFEAKETREIAAPEGPPPLRRGDSGDAVAELQAELQRIGHHVGDLDGQFGALTERAIVTVQHEHGLPVTGVADAATVRVIRATTAARLPRSDMTERDLGERGSRTYSEAKHLTLWGRTLKWLGFGTSGTVLAEVTSPGVVTETLPLLPRLAETLTSPAMLKLYAIGGGAALLVLGWRISQGGRRIIGYRLDDLRSGKHIGR